MSLAIANNLVIKRQGKIIKTKPLDNLDSKRIEAIMSLKDLIDDLKQLEKHTVKNTRKYHVIHDIRFTSESHLQSLSQVSF